MPGIRFKTAFRVFRGTKAFVNLECGLTRGAVPNPRQQVEDQARDLRKYKRRLKERREALKERDREILRLKALSAAEGRAEGGPKGGPQRAEVPGSLPDFLIIGTQKGGTSFLYHVLADHPLVAPAVRTEVHYFDTHRFARGDDWYRSHFPRPEREDGREVVVGEASPYYMYHPHAARRAAQLVPGARLISLLRNPVDRAYSDYRHKLNDGLETLSFEEAIEAEEERTRGEKEKMLADENYGSRSHRWHSYLDRGIYVDQLAEWRKFFGEDQLLVLKSEHLFERPADGVGTVLDFLGLPPWDRKDFGRGRNRRSYEPMSPETRGRLAEYYEPHNQRLYDFLGVDFGW